MDPSGNIEPRKDHRLRRRGGAGGARKRPSVGGHVSYSIAAKPRSDPWTAVQAALKRRGFALTNEKAADHG